MVFADRTLLCSNECNLTDAQLYFGEPAIEPSIKVKDKGKQKLDAEEEEDEEKLFVVNKDLARLHWLNIQVNTVNTKSVLLERREINFEANPIIRAIGKRISLPPACMQLPFQREEYKVEQLKTFIVTFQRKGKKKNNKAAKCIVFYRGDLVPQAPHEDDFGWSEIPKVPQNSSKKWTSYLNTLKKCAKSKTSRRYKKLPGATTFNNYGTPRKLEGRPISPRKTEEG